MQNFTGKKGPGSHKLSPGPLLAGIILCSEQNTGELFSPVYGHDLHSHMLFPPVISP